MVRPSSVASTPLNSGGSPYVMRLRPLRTSASLLRVVRGTLDLLEISLRTDVTDAGTWGMLPRMRT